MIGSLWAVLSTGGSEVLQLAGSLLAKTDGEWLRQTWRARRLVQPPSSSTRRPAWPRTRRYVLPSVHCEPPRAWCGAPPPSSGPDPLRNPLSNLLSPRRLLLLPVVGVAAGVTVGPLGTPRRPLSA